MTITTAAPWQLSIDPQALDDLQRRLENTRWPERETCDDWSQGTPLEYARELAHYWQHEYDWRRCETAINQWPNYTMDIDGQTLHFIHARSPHENARPLLITHGWPGSVLEFLPILEALTNPTAHGGAASDAFHVICPSLPGFGFSGKPVAAGTGIEKIASLWDALMQSLGYSRYFAQGGDWGSMITHVLAQTGKGCAGIHINMPLAGPDPAAMNDLTEQEQAAIAVFTHYHDHESGYSKQQSTRPQTIGYGLADSPVGQMCWIVEKFYAWSDCERNGQRHPEYVFSKDTLLDNVMLYWLSNSAASSARLYWESFNSREANPITIPVGCSLFPKELSQCSERWARRRYQQLVYWNELDRGGHFAALEQPEIFVQELRQCFAAMQLSPD